MKRFVGFVLAVLLTAAITHPTKAGVYGTPGDGRVLVHVAPMNAAAGGDYWVNPQDGFLWLVEHALKTEWNKIDLRRVRLLREKTVRVLNTDKLAAYPFILQTGDTICVPISD